LVSFDAHSARVHFPTSIPISIANPIHTLYAPAKTERPSRSNLTSTLSLAGWDSVFVAKRYSQPVENDIQSVILIAQSLLDNNSLIISQEEVDKLSSNTEIISVSSLEEVQAFEEQTLETMIDNSLAFVEKSADKIFIESFNDSAWPWEGLDSVDRVFAVGPGHLFEYDPERFRKAVFMLHKGMLPVREISLNRVDELLRPVSRYELVPEKGLPESLGQLELE
jgi:predicted P-loop ATPase/GTPase